MLHPFESRSSVSGKMALLIGNKDYRHADRLGHLFHPVNDVCELSASLTALDFKVTSPCHVSLVLDSLAKVLVHLAKLLYFSDKNVYQLLLQVIVCFSDPGWCSLFCQTDIHITSIRMLLIGSWTNSCSSRFRSVTVNILGTSNGKLGEQKQRRKGRGRGTGRIRERKRSYSSFLALPPGPESPSLVGVASLVIVVFTVSPEKRHLARWQLNYSSSFSVEIGNMTTVGTSCLYVDKTVQNQGDKT